MTTMTSNFEKITLALVAAALLSACGGGSGGSPSVSSMSATNVSYGRTMTVSINGASLTSAELQLIVEGPCSDVTRVAGATDLLLQFTCKVTGVGDLFPRVRTLGGQELASMSLNVPLPQVSMTVTQGTRSGTYVVELDPTAARVTVDNFLAYVNAATSFYRNTIFHRVIPGFVVQAGGFTAGPTAKAPTFGPIVLEANNGLKNLRGTIAMARSGAANSATSQFFINLVDNPGLDFGSASNPDGYAVFGKVVSGLDIVDEIAKVETRVDLPTELTNLPVVNVVITAASQIK